MTTTNLSDFETSLQLRPLTVDPYDERLALSKLCFPTLDPWTRANLRNQLATWAESHVGLFLDDRMVATCAHFIVVAAEVTNWADWEAMADEGDIGNHDPEGDTLYGIEIQVHPEFRGRKLARRLYDFRKDLCRRHKLRAMAIGGRIPGYAHVQDRMTAREYVEQVEARRRYDPVLTTQLANGFVVRELLPDYMPTDEDSAGYATHCEWVNLDHVPPRKRVRTQVTEPVRAALMQYQMRAISSWDDFERQVRFFVSTASDNRSDFVVFPELFTLQLLSLVKPGRPGAAARTLADFTPRYLETFVDLAKRYNTNGIGGSQFAVEDGVLYNVSYLFRRDGSIERQRKIHVTPFEAEWWGVSGGDEVQAFETDVGKVGILICYDVEFPELARVLAHDGVRLLFVPYNTENRYGHLRVRTCAAARAIENHMAVVTAGCVGNLPSVENADVHYAQSAFLEPSDVGFARDGVAAEAEPNLETVLPHDIDLAALRRYRRRGTVRPWADRRRDLYRVRWKPGTPAERDI